MGLEHLHTLLKEIKPHADHKDVVNHLESLAKPTRRPTMTAGHGKHSYVQNSNWQAEFMNRVFKRGNLFTAIDGMQILTDGTDLVRVADFGCSSSPNTIRNVKTILRRMNEKRSGRSAAGQLYQAFFQDLHLTDFNTLFRLFQVVSVNSADNASVDDLKYFAAAVPGSCFDQLFPPASLHFVMSSFALMWLSKIPPEVSSPNHEAYYGDVMLLEFASKATVDAYREQGNKDLRNFLEARAVEMAPGGVMNLVFGVRRNYYPYYICPTDKPTEEVWDEMISEGLMEASLRESYQSPRYFHHLKDVEEIMGDYSSLFEIHHQEVVPFFTYPPGLTAGQQSARYSSLHRGVFNNILVGHFGEEITEMFWKRYEEKTSRGFSDGTIVDSEDSTFLFLVLVASRKETKPASTKSGD
ncbi:hypothetical protein R1sor_016621 [Riccia sorocarpa]|uniref:Uncharacterized protein n=1 Tax=Riccia sorocarpa TaxID=122646 RepID=A0ABD3HIV3_9MARC